MNKPLTTLLSTAVLVSAVAMPTHAAVVDQVKTRVDQIKADTNLLKSRTSTLSVKTNELINRAEETASTANAIIAETDVIKEALAPIRQMKERFADLQFDPAELLANEELADMVQKFQAEKAAAEARLNDPDLETYRSELLGVLEGVRNIAAENVQVWPDRTPLQNLVEAAPMPLLAALKFSTETVFADLRDDVLGLADLMTQLRSDGVFDDAADAYCYANKGVRKARYLLTVRATKKAIKVIRHLKVTAPKVAVKEWELGVHGYTSIKVKSGEKARKQVAALIAEMEAVKDRLDLKRETLADEVSCEG